MPDSAQQPFPADVPYLVRKVLGPTTRLRAGSLTTVLPDGRKVHLDSGAPGPQAELVIKDYNFARRLLASGELGFGEAYLQGEWDSPKLETLIELMSVNRKVIDEVMPGRFTQRMLSFSAMRSTAIRAPERARTSGRITISATASTRLGSTTR